jgi:predicted DNA-binding protein (MmcQ/YjbR family)
MLSKTLTKKGGKRKMKYNWLNKYCLAQAGATKEYKPEWNATRYLVGGKMFALSGGDKEEKPIITLKLDPAHGDMLRQQYKDIVPGYFMNKEHWNSLYLDGEVPDDVVKTMITESYQLIFKSLNKKLQKEIVDGEP